MFFSNLSFLAANTCPDMMCVNLLFPQTLSYLTSSFAFTKMEGISLNLYIFTAKNQGRYGNGDNLIHVNNSNNQYTKEDDLNVYQWVTYKKTTSTQHSHIHALQETHKKHHQTCVDTEHQRQECDLCSYPVSMASNVTSTKL